MLLPLMAGCAKVDDRRLIQKEGFVRGMRGMANGAIPFLYRKMGYAQTLLLPFCGGLFLLFYCHKLVLLFQGVLVTFPAKAYHVPIDQIFLR
jgi:hypothetical protein